MLYDFSKNCELFLIILLLYGNSYFRCGMVWYIPQYSLKKYIFINNSIVKFYIFFNFTHSSSSSDDEDDGSSSENQDAHSERSQESARLTKTLTPNHSKSLSSPHTGQNIPIHPVMKSSSNPAVDKQAMGITSGKAYNFETLEFIF